MDVIDIIKDYNHVEHIRNLDFEELGWKCSMLAITHDGTIWHYTGTYSFVLRNDVPFAIGSGAQFALGAMAFGADAKEAVLIASRYDLHTNANLQVANLIEEEPEEEKIH